MVKDSRVSKRPAAHALAVLLGIVAACAAITTGARPAWVQAAESPPPAAEKAGEKPATADEQAAKLADAEAKAQEALAAETSAPDQATEETPAPDPTQSERMNFLELMLSGGPLMIPIGLFSLVVVTFGLERALGLRRRKIMPPKLIRGLGNLASQKGGLDPRLAYRLCQEHPSTAANVIRTMLLKVGRPHSEVERAVADANEREAARLYSNVRWLNLSSGVSPLLGLLGTVQGMIQAFFVTANLPAGVNKGQFLAEGIYVALVTTFAGLAVAIPATVLSHFFEGKIQNLFRELDETLLGLLPQLERFEGRLRVSQDQFEGRVAEHVQPPPVQAESRRSRPAPRSK